jgi:2-methylcitrate dehydratase PrpD
MLAQQGFVGPDTILEGKHGTLSGYSDNAEPSRLTESLGERFYITRAAIKPHACCRYNQGPIDCMLAIRREHNVLPEEIEGVRVGMLSAGFPIVSEPDEYKRNARSIVDAQFSVPFAIAVAAVCGRASLEEYTDDVIARDDVRGVMARVESVRDAALDAVYPRQWPAWVEVDTTDGRSMRSEVQYPLGEPENPLSWEQLEDKFRSITSPVISSSRQDEIIAAVHALETMDDVRDLAWLTGG